jgi:hypothetical protein
MKLYSYVLARDYGFAPNPFSGWCSLATCKPKVRKGASLGDWIIATGAKTKYNLAGHLMYAMRVDEAIDFTSYWNDARFLAKRPVLNGSLKQLYGDNIYEKRRGRWSQADSHHSYEGGKRNLRNIARDTSVDRVLLSQTFVYFGSEAPVIPKRFRPYRTTGEDLCCSGQGHRVLSAEIARALETWLRQRDEWGLQGMPLEFRNHARIHANDESIVASAAREKRSLNTRTLKR